MVDFPESGMWGADLLIKVDDKTYDHVLVTFAVPPEEAPDV